MGAPKILDPWGIEEVEDYDETIETWGLSRFEDILQRIKDPHYLMKRGIIFAHRDFDVVLDCIEQKKPFVMMTGLMPSGKMHLGHRLVAEQMKWYQEQGAQLVIAISDIEAWVTKKIPPSKALEIATNEYILNYLALGIKPENLSVYSQWSRPELLNLALAFSGLKNFGEMNSIYGFIKDDNWGVQAGKTFFPFVQAADILHPQLKNYGGPRPIVVPVGIDQDPHMRLTRDIAEKMRLFSFRPASENGLVAVYPTGKKTTLDSIEKVILDLGFEKSEVGEEGETKELVYRMPNANALVIKKIATGEIENIHEHLSSVGLEVLVTNNRYGIYVPTENDVEKLLSLAESKLKEQGYKYMDKILDYGALFLYDPGEINVYGINRSLIEIEAELGHPTFFKPGMTYNKLAKGLGAGGKMSSSDPSTAIFLTDMPEDVRKKISNVITGGAVTAEEQKEKGGQARNCIVYNLLYFNHPEYKVIKETYEGCKSGSLLCGECKENTIKYFREFLSDLHEKREKIRESGELQRFIDSQDIIKKGDSLYW